MTIGTLDSTYLAFECFNQRERIASKWKAVCKTTNKIGIRLAHDVFVTAAAVAMTRLLHYFKPPVIVIENSPRYELFKFCSICGNGGEKLELTSMFKDYQTLCHAQHSCWGGKLPRMTASLPTMTTGGSSHDRTTHGVWDIEWEALVSTPTIRDFLRSFENMLIFRSQRFISTSTLPLLTTFEQTLCSKEL